MSAVKAYAAQSPTSTVEPFAIERRAPRPDDVVIEIDYCGICHSDIHTAHNDWGFTVYPVVPGHEIVGHVTAVGKDVKNFRPGDRVGVGCLVDSCRQLGRKTELAQLAQDLNDIGFEAVGQRTLYAEAFAA